jgi:hypothetical protein
MAHLGKVQREARKFYDKWRKTGSYCPAFKSAVKVSLKGWRHITGATGYTKRTRDDTHRRLKLLPKAKEIIETSTTIQNVTKIHRRRYYALEAMVKVPELGKDSLRKVRVIIVEDKQGNKIFYSVTDKKLGRRHAK